jgi:hypothetical protein
VTGQINSDFYDYNYVDQFNTLGLGANAPVLTGSGSDSLVAFAAEDQRDSGDARALPL